jgi:hypothetical protein
MSNLSAMCPTCCLYAIVMNETDQLIYCACESCKKGGYWLERPAYDMLTDLDAAPELLARRRARALNELSLRNVGVRTQPLHRDQVATG